MITLRKFLENNGYRFWVPGTYYNVVTSQILRFCDFRDHDFRGINKFKPQDFYDFMDHLRAEG